LPKPILAEPFNSLEIELIEAMRRGLKDWRPDLDYPESVSDMQGCVRGVLQMFEVKRLPVAIRLPIKDRG